MKRTLTSLVAILLSLAIAANAAYGAYTMTTPTFNALVATTPLTCGGATGGGSTTGLTIKVKDGSGGVLGTGTAGAAPGGMWTGFASESSTGLWPSPGVVLNPILYDAALTPVCFTYCHT